MMTKRMALRGEASYNFFGSQPSAGASQFGAPAYLVGGAGAIPLPNSSGVNVGITVANRVFAALFFLPFAIRVTKCSIAVGTAAAANSLNAGLYDANGNLLVDSGALSTAVGAGVVVTGIVNALIQSQFLFAAWACTSITPTFASLPVNAGSSATNSNLYGPLLVFGSNVLAAGALPATLGTLTTIGGVTQIPAMLWQA